MTTTLYSLTPREADTLSNLDQSDVIAIGPWRKGFGSLAHRAVIRDHGDQFVVHTQIVGDSNAYCEHGVYIPKSEDESLFVAWRAFEIRVRRHHGFLLHD